MEALWIINLVFNLKKNIFQDFLKLYYDIWNNKVFIIYLCNSLLSLFWCTFFLFFCGIHDLQTNCHTPHLLTRKVFFLGLRRVLWLIIITSGWVTWSQNPFLIYRLVFFPNKKSHKVFFLILFSFFKNKVK